MHSLRVLLQCASDLALRWRQTALVAACASFGACGATSTLSSTHAEPRGLPSSRPATSNPPNLGRAGEARTFEATHSTVAEPGRRAQPANADRDGSRVDVPYETPLLEPAALRDQARATCERALERGLPILIEFSAAWCSDCSILRAIKAAPPLRVELADWEILTINVGNGVQHPELMKAFRVEAIAKLVVTRPRNCAAQLRVWHPRATRTLSGLTGDRERMNEALAEWLEAQRASVTR